MNEGLYLEHYYLRNENPHLVDVMDDHRIAAGLEPRFPMSLKDERKIALLEISKQLRNKATECVLHAIQLWLEMEHGLRCELSLDGLKVYF